MKRNVKATKTKNKPDKTLISQQSKIILNTTKKIDSSKPTNP